MPHGGSGRRRGFLARGGLAAACLSLAAAGPAGDPSKRLNIPGLGGQAFLAGSGIDVNGDSMMIHPQSGASIVSACNPEWRPEDITQFKFVGKTLSFTVDLSGVGCACNLAFYLVSAPAKDPNGNPIPGNNDLAPGNFYCDANKVGGQWCPEVDIMEANNHAFQSTPHKCDPPTNGHYPSCDRGGCGQNTRDMANAYGPGGNFRIDTTKPFKVITAWTEHKGNLAGMVTTLQQGSERVTLDHGTCAADYYAALSPAMVSGMSVRITYWGSSAETMSWLDKPPCGEESCGAGAGTATISNMEIRDSTGASVGGQTVMMAPSPAGAPLPSGQPTTWQPPEQPSVTAAPAQVFDCSEGYLTWEGWHADKKSWCCSNKGIACHEFNCFQNLDNWGQDWSSTKQAWCCKHKAQGCPQSPGAPGAGARQQIGPLRWSNFPNKCVTDMGGPNADLVIIDCAGPNGNAQQVWQSIGDGSIRLAGTPSRCIEIPDEMTPQNGGRVQVSLCRQGLLGQEFSINTANMKIQWKAHREYCLDITDHKTADGTPLQLWKCMPMSTDQVFAWPVIPQPGAAASQGGQAAPQTQTTQAPATGTTQFVWEPSMVLPPTASPGATPSGAPSPQAPTSWPGWSGTLGDEEQLGGEEEIGIGPTETYTTTTVADPYHCDGDDLSSRPYKQRVWCCGYKHVGCPVMIPQTWRYEPPFDYAVHTRGAPEITAARTGHLLHPGDVFRIQSGLVGVDGVLYLNLTDGKGWIFESRPGIGTICVETRPVPITTVAPYDCEAEFDRWQFSWSASKKAWCCSYRQRGCPDSTTQAAAEGASPTFDCSVGYDNWKSEWTVRQASYCCTAKGRGCTSEAGSSSRADPPQYDCTLWFPGYERTWPQEQRLWCCRHKAQGCPKLHVKPEDQNCEEGAPSTWKPRKRIWCCAYRGVGCGGQDAAHFSRQFAEHGSNSLEVPGGAGAQAERRAVVVEALLAGAAGLCLMAVAGLVLLRSRRRETPDPRHIRRCLGKELGAPGRRPGGGPPRGIAEEDSLLRDLDRSIHPE